MDIDFDNNLLTLQQMLETVGRAVQRALPDRIRLIAEISQMSSSRGHVYLDLVQKEDGGLIAKARATIWQFQARRIMAKFTADTGQTLSAGMNVLLCASANWHAVYGFSINIHAIDTDYTLGEMARQKREVIERLQREGLIEYNKSIPFPIVPQRIAIISSASAAGYEDFIHQIENNASLLRFTYRLFETSVQGNEAERSLIEALYEARLYADSFDVLVLIRGGGSKTDLHCFDSYALARELATFPLPVITGIGHERDDSVADMVAGRRCKTPTAVAELLIRATLEFEDRLIEMQTRLIRAASMQMESARHQVDTAARKLQTVVLQTVSREAQDLRGIQEGLSAAAKLRLERERDQIERLSDKISLLDPVNILKRGYSLVYSGNALVRSAWEVRPSQTITIRFADGSLGAQINEIEHEPEDQAPNAI